MNFTGNSNRILLVHRHMESVSTDAPVDVMLTPQFYTMKKEALPVRYAYQAKKVAPSLFDGLLENHTDHEYFVYREGEKWVFVAYDIGEIISFLEQKGIPPEKIGKIYFAQQALEVLKKPVALGEKEAMTVLDDTVVVVPRSALPQTDFMLFDENFRPSQGIRPEIGAASILTRKQAIVLAVVFFLFGTIWLAEGVRYGKNNGKLQLKLSDLYESYPSLQSAYTRENIVSKYRKIDRIERRKREIIGKVAGLIFKGVTLTELELTSKKYRVVFVLNDIKVKRRFEQLLKSAGLKKSSRSSDREIIVEGTL